MNVMLDLETWGTRPGCAIRSIGAVAFDFAVESADANTFYHNISDISCGEVGLNWEAGTVEWWKQQPKEASDALLLDQKPLLVVAREFKVWWARLDSLVEPKVWSQGANFDTVLWEFACRAVGLEAPWRFFNVRDTRTLYEAARLDSKAIPRKGVYHHALDDCHHQILCCRMAHSSINSKRRHTEPPLTRESMA